MTVFAFTHSEPVETRQRLKDLERHGLRIDRLARENLRPGAVAGAGLDWPDAVGRQLTKAYADFKKRHDVDPRKGAQLLHSIGIGVSPIWIRDAGDLHDPANPRNVLLFKAAIAWVKSFAGNDAIVSARMDLDEESGRWVDAYFAPISDQKYKGAVENQVSDFRKQMPGGNGGQPGVSERISPSRFEYRLGKACPSTSRPGHWTRQARARHWQGASPLGSIQG